MALCIDIPYKAGTVNHVLMDEMTKITNTRFIWHMLWTPSTIQRQIKNYMFGYRETGIHRLIQYTHGHHLLYNISSIYCIPYK